MAFHIFRINEVYSNADGSIQFIEFVGEQDNQDLWNGHQITSSNGVTTNTYNIVGDLPSAATNAKSVLMATQGFVDLGLGVTPDYIIPANFLFISNGAIDYVGMNEGSLSYALLPTDGVLSLDHNGATQVNSPTNFSGQTGTVVLNHDPELVNPIADQVAGVGQVFSLFFPGAFSDPDPEILGYSATLSDGTALPGWLSLNSIDTNFLGTPGATDTGTITVKLVAHDFGDSAVFDTFNIKVISGHVIKGDALANSLVGTNKRDLITGLAGNDTMNGGSGADTMVGGTGNDTYVVGVATDVVTEFAAGGTDTVKTGIDYTLGANVERLTLTGSLASDGIGNGSNNLINGNAAANVLRGSGGADTLAGGSGADTLSGGGGNDVFVLNGALGTADRILDFQSGGDRIQIENSIFTALTSTGALAPSAVQIGLQSAVSATSGDAGDFLKYATDTGRLYYDANGSASGGLQLIATVLSGPLTPALIVPATDLFVI